MTRKSLIAASACVGAAGALAGGSLSLARSIGATPVRLTFNMSAWTPTQQFGGVPVEIPVLVWFVAVLLIVRRKRERLPLSFPAVLSVTAAVVLGAGIWLLADEASWCWPLVIVSACASVILVSAATDPRWPKSLAPAAQADLRLLLQSRQQRTAVAMFCAVAMVTGSTVHVMGSRVPRDAARLADLRRWYMSVTNLPANAATSELRSPNRVRIVVFTGYEWSPRGHSVYQSAAQADLFRQRGLPVEFVIRQHPADSVCLDSTLAAQANSTSCEAAYAVTLVEQLRGEAAALATIAWLHARATVLSIALIQDHLLELGLQDEYRTRHDSLVEAVVRDLELGRRLGVTSTPAYFINGTRVPQVRDGLMSLLRFEEERRVLTRNAAPRLRE
jgi:hypothetical protein